MISLTSEIYFNNSKLFFSRIELNKILACYSLGVSRGNWKDYAINFRRNEAKFFIFKNSFATPHCILTKSIKNKKNKYVYDLNIGNFNKNNFNKIDDLLIFLKRKNFRLLN
tara:strand:- start:255 stop:587 length:333 start_codon:yes stop_codon:yes gene_type:complete